MTSQGCALAFATGSPCLGGGTCTGAQLPEAARQGWVLSHVRPAGAWCMHRVQSCTSACSSTSFASLFLFPISWEGIQGLLAVGEGMWVQACFPKPGRGLYCSGADGEVKFAFENCNKSDAFTDPLVWDDLVERAARFLPPSGCCHIPEGQKALHLHRCTYQVSLVWQRAPIPAACPACVTKSAFGTGSSSSTWAVRLLRASWAEFMVVWGGCDVVYSPLGNHPVADMHGPSLSL